MKISFYFVALLLIFDQTNSQNLSLRDGEKQNIQIQSDHTNWTYNLSVYEVNVRQYTKEGTFNAFNNHLDRLKNLGVGILWFMPIHPIGIKNHLGSLGSYYSVKDYYGVNPEFGTLQDFKALVDSIHKKGMYVVIDWVANHTSWDNSLTQTHPEWYQKNGSGNFIAPPNTNWSDVIQLDYTKQELRNYMITAMSYWITEIKVDGFRYDAASFVPVDFWTQVATELKKVKPDILLIAEDQGAKYFTAGFAMTYAWNFYGFGGGILTQLYSGKNNANDFYTYVQNENSENPNNNYRMYFTSNHDENSWYGTDKELFGNAAENFIALSHVLRSVPLIYGGQEAALDHRLKFFDKDEIVWKADPRSKMYQTLLQLKRTNSALWNGTSGSNPNRITTSNDNDIFAFVREKGNDRVIGIFNLSQYGKSFTITDTGCVGIYRDVFNDSSVSLTKNYGVSLPGWGYKIFEKKQIVGGIHDTPKAPQIFFLSQNYPNPFNPTTTIKFSLPEETNVSLKIFDILGREVAELVHEYAQPGTYSVSWNAFPFASGMYFYKLSTKNSTLIKRMLLIK